MLPDLTPYGCADCGIARDRHGRQFLLGEGGHQWRAPDDTVIKQRMLARRHARLTREQPKYHAVTAWAPDATGESGEPYCADCKTDTCRRWLRIQDRRDRSRWDAIPKLTLAYASWGGDVPF
jgi:hypothetical protein